MYPKAYYYMVFGERSNGKTFSVLEYGIEQYFKTGGELAIIRRMEEDFKHRRGQQMFSALVSTGKVEKYSGGKYNWIEYYAGRWYFAKRDELGRIIKAETPFAYAFSISSMEHDKSTSYPNVENILFDEFITREYYFPNEFVLFMNVLSTIIRERNNVKVFMLGNTVNKFCPYFDEMGIKHIKDMKKGSVDVYTYGASNLQVVVEYAENNVKGKKSDSYFAFDNPKLHMITGGEWEIDIYPHLPIKYKPNQVLFNYFIEFDKQLFHCEIITTDEGDFTYIHRKTTPLKDDETDIIFTTNFTNHYRNKRRNIIYPYDKIGKKIYSFFKKEKVFYQSNDVGEAIANYLKWCGI